MPFRLFMDETTLGGSNYFYIQGLFCPESKYGQLKADYKALKETLASKGLISRANVEFHLSAIKERKRKGAFGPLEDAEKRREFWAELSSFYRRAPIRFTSALVYAREVKRAREEDWNYRTKILGLSSVIENSVVAASELGANRYLIAHDWVDDNNYKDHLKWLISRGELRLVSKTAVHGVFDRNIHWVPKEEREAGIELTDLITTPVCRYFLGQKDTEVPEELVQFVVDRFVCRNDAIRYNPFSARLLP